MQENNLNIETFGEIIDGFLEENHVRMLLDMPEGTEDVTITDNTGMGPAVWLYILSHAMVRSITALEKMSGCSLDRKFVRAILGMIEEEIMKRKEEKK